MKVDVKICGLRDAASVAAAVEGGASYLGFVFYAKSPRVVDARSAASLIRDIPAAVIPVGLFVDPSDDELTHVLELAPLLMIQLHGNETAARVAAVKRMTGLPVIKAVGIATRADVEAARLYQSAADMLLLDAKPPVGGLPGGNAAVFDWSLLKDAGFAKPWMLAGGLNETNVTAAVAATGARIVDVSSGVEESVGRKSPDKIRAFLDTVGGIEV